MKVEVKVPSEFQGTVTGDINKSVSYPFSFIIFFFWEMQPCLVDLTVRAILPFSIIKKNGNNKREDKRYITALLYMIIF